MEKIFKAKRLDTGEWVEIELAILFLIIEIGGVCEIDKNTISQYTGLNDSEDNKIFEGDEIYVAGVGNVIVTITVDGVMFGDEDYQSCIEDIEHLTGHNIHDRG